MNIVLLSGGSGKRLWPLSNDSRSKQFLRLIQKEDGRYESMVQRVYRQIGEAGIDAHIVVATGSSQVDSICSQLGGAVDIVVEPERRDTFPAIALATAFFAFSKGVDLSDPVVVLPVDPYAGPAYFQTLTKMERAVRGDAADIVLMGIKPSYPSTKYGYMLTEKLAKEDGVCSVRKFVEKPDEETAGKLIEQGAVWNAGVFAFRLSYVLGLIQKTVPEPSFEEVKARYGSLQKTSFDYAVVEKASSVAMVPYEGAWKDLGTWNTLTEELRDPVIGRATLGEGTEGTHVINELSIPIVVLGAKNMVVAASPDGILVTDKQKSSHLKPYVDGLNARPMFEEKSWGNYRVIDCEEYPDGVRSLTKRLTVLAGKTVSYQRHAIRDEILTVADGQGEVTIDGHTRNVRRGDVIYVVKGQRHAFKALTNVRMIEVQIGEKLTEDDVEECGPGEKARGKKRGPAKARTDRHLIQTNIGGAL